MKRAWRAIKAWWKPLSGVTKGVIIALFVLVGMSGSVAVDQGSEELARESAATTTVAVAPLAAIPTTSTTTVAPPTTIVVLPSGCQEAVDVLTEDFLEMLDSQDFDTARANQLGEDVGASCLSHSPLAMSPFIILLGDRKDVVSQGSLGGLCEGMKNVEDLAGIRMTAEAGAVCDGVLADAPATISTATTTTAATTQFTRSEQNAIAKAADYLGYTSFSRSGLIAQLEYEGFSTAESTLAVDFLNADWNEQAWMKAEEYLAYSAFSRSGLIDQLKYEGFTTEQATYGVDKAGL